MGVLLAPQFLINSVSGYAITAAGLTNGTSSYWSRTFGAGGDQQTFTLRFPISFNDFGSNGDIVSV